MGMYDHLIKGAPVNPADGIEEINATPTESKPLPLKLPQYNQFVAPTPDKPSTMAKASVKARRLTRPKINYDHLTNSAKPEKERGVIGTISDAGVTAIKSAISVPEVALGIADLFSGGRAGKYAEDHLGFRPKDAKETLNTWYTDAQKEANAKVAAAKGFVPTVVAALENPSTIAHTVGESIAPMLSGGVIARGLTKLAPKVPGYVAGATGEGIVGAGMAAEQTRQNTKDGLLTDKQSAAAGASGLGTGVFGVVGGRIAQKFGIADIDTMLATGGLKATNKSVARSFVESGISEGVFEELPQSIQEQMWSNVAMGKPIMDGVPEGAAMGMLAGVGMGGVAGGVSSYLGNNNDSIDENNTAPGDYSLDNLAAEMGKERVFDPNAPQLTAPPDFYGTADGATKTPEQQNYSEQYRQHDSAGFTGSGVEGITPKGTMAKAAEKAGQAAGLANTGDPVLPPPRRTLVDGIPGSQGLSRPDFSSNVEKVTDGRRDLTNPQAADPVEPIIPPEPVDPVAPDPVEPESKPDIKKYKLPHDLTNDLTDEAVSGIQQAIHVATNDGGVDLNDDEVKSFIKNYKNGYNGDPVDNTVQSFINESAVQLGANERRHGEYHIYRDEDENDTGTGIKRPVGKINKKVKGFLDAADKSINDVDELTSIASQLEQTAKAARSQFVKKQAEEAAASIRKYIADNYSTNEPVTDADFTPTHELTDGTKVIAYTEDGEAQADTWQDSEGNIIEDGNAEPISRSDDKDSAPEATIPDDYTRVGDYAYGESPAGEEEGGWYVYDLNDDNGDPAYIAKTEEDAKAWINSASGKDSAPEATIPEKEKTNKPEKPKFKKKDILAIKKESIKHAVANTEVISNAKDEAKLKESILKVTEDYLHDELGLAIDKEHKDRVALINHVTHASGKPDESVFDDNFISAVSRKAKAAFNKAEKEKRKAENADRGEKLKNYGEELRRAQDEATRKIDDADDANLDKAVKDILNAASRPNVFPIVTGENATLGLTGYLETIRNGIEPVSEWIGHQFGGGRRSWQKSFKTVISEKSRKDGGLDEIKELAKEYIDHVSAIAQAVSGKDNIRSAAESFGDYLDKVRASFIDVFRGNFYHQSYALRIDPDGNRYDPGYNLGELLKNEDSESSTGRRKPLRRPSLPIKRSGFKTDHRNGEDVTLEDIGKKFGFAAVTGGKYVRSKEGQERANFAYDAFMDLADTLGIKPKDISLGGTLHFTIGALGRGRHSAHYSPSHPHPKGGTVPVINVTKTRGDGSVAHEWFHALDYALRSSLLSDNQSSIVSDIVDALSERIKTIDGIKKELHPYLTGNRYWYIKGRKHSRYSPNESTRMALRRLSLTKQTDYKNDADEIEKGGNKKRPYWNNREELFARAGESYIYDVLTGDENTYLVSDWVEADKIGKPLYKGRPYPNSKERKAMQDLFAGLMENITFDSKGVSVNSDYESADIKTQVTKLRLKVEGMIDAWIKAIRDEKSREEDDLSIGILGGNDLIRKLYRAIYDGSMPKDNNALKKLVAEHDGVPVKDIDHARLKQAQEDLEAAIVMRSRAIIKDHSEFRGGKSEQVGDKMIFESLLGLYNSQPNLNLQTTASANNQAYSTPAPLAFLAARLSDTKNSDWIYEPTAGNGMLLIDSDLRSSVFANELDADRNSRLKDTLPYASVSNFDATTHEFSYDKKFESIITNPPFGSLAEKTEFDGYTLEKIDHLIAAKALSEMSDTGKATLILGANKNEGAITSKDRVFLNYLYSHYNVTEHFEVSGDMYKRQGAGWPVRIIAIDGRKSSTKKAPKSGAIKRVNSYEELYRKYQEIQGYEFEALDTQPEGFTGETGVDGGGNTGESGGTESSGLPGDPGKPNTGSGRAGGSRPGNENSGGQSGSGVSATGTTNSGSGNGDSGSNAGDGVSSGAGNEGTNGERTGNSGSADSPTDAGNDSTGVFEPDLNAADFSEEDFDSLLDAEFGKDEQSTDDAENEFGDAINDLDDLFGKDGIKFSKRKDFNEETYQKAQPLFKQALEHALSSAASLKEAFKSFIKMASERWGKTIRPYLKQFQQDIKAGIVKIVSPSKKSPEKPNKSNKKESTGSEFQTSYPSMSENTSGNVLVPTNQADAVQAALSDIVAKYGNIDDFVVNELGYKSKDEAFDALMGLQIDSVAMAIDQIKTGGALIIGDQTGVGKGRQAAAVIRWALINGFTPVFISVKPTLYTDMFYDLKDIGSDITPLLTNAGEAVIEHGTKKALFKQTAGKLKPIFSKIINEKSLPKGTDALFTTYAQINTENQRRDVLRSLASNAVFVLDESHNAAGDSSTGEFIKAVLEQSDRAVYLSATYAKRPSNMPVYFLTDISKATDTMEELVESVVSGGVPLMEMVSNQLTRAGQFIRRERSWEGIDLPTYIDPDKKSQQRDEEYSNEVTRRLRAIVDADRIFHNKDFELVKAEIEAEFGGSATGSGNNASAGVHHANFTSVVHNSISQMILSIKTDRIADMAIEGLKAGKKPFIAIDATMGSFLDDHVAFNKLKEGDLLTGFDYRVVLSRNLKRTRNISYKDDKGKKNSIIVPLHQLSQEAQNAYEWAQDLIDSLDADLSASPIDRIKQRIQDAGYSVKEITGRTRSVTYDDKGNAILSSIDKEEKGGRVNTISEFNNGTLDVVIANAAGATGISAHASEKFQDQRPRYMIVGQASLDINIFMQMLGRVNRTGQVVLPEYRIFSSSLPSEKRPQAVTAMKMKQLNANTSSNESSDTSVEAVDFMNKYGDEVVARYLDENKELNAFLQIGFDLDGETPSVQNVARNATGRLALMPVKIQAEFYDRVESEYLDYIKYLNENGRNELIARTIPFDAVLLEEHVLDEGTDNSRPLLSDAMIGKYSVKRTNLPPTPQEVKKEIERSLDGKTASEHAMNLLAPALEYNDKTLVPEINKNISESYSKLSDEDKEKVGAEGNSFPFDDNLSARQHSYQRAVTRKQRHDESVAQIIGAIEKNYLIGNASSHTIDGAHYRGVVTGVKSKWTKGSPSNPFVKSGYSITIRTNSGTGRISLPLSRLMGYQDLGHYGYGGVTQESDIDALFKKAAGHSANDREIRYIATKNLLKAFGSLTSKGEIARFTMKDGSVTDGIVMPGNFDPSTGIKKTLRFGSPAVAIQFLHDNTYDSDVHRLGLHTKDGNLRLTPNYDGSFNLVAAGSKKAGGKWWANTELVSIIGDEFAGSRAVKTAKVPSNKVKSVVDFIYQTDKLFALESMEKLVAPYISKGNSAPDGKPSFSKHSVSANNNRSGGVTEQELQDVIERFKQELGGKLGLDFIIADSQEAAFGEYGASITERVRGAYISARSNKQRSRVIVIRGNLRNIAEAESTLLHETLAHHGLNLFEKDVKTAILRKIHNSRELPAIKKVYRQLIRDGYDLSPAGMAEEVFAYIAENKPNFAIRAWDQIVTIIANALRKYGLLSGKVTKSELRNLVQSIAEGMRQGQQQRTFEDGKEIHFGASDPVFYSKMLDHLIDKLPGSGNAMQLREMVKSWARKGQFKQEELEWSGLVEWLSEQKGKVSKDDIVNFVQANQVQIHETERGESLFRTPMEAKQYLAAQENMSIDEIEKQYAYVNQDAYIEAAEDAAEYEEEKPSYATKHDRYQLKGGKNYRELVMSMPGQIDPYKPDNVHFSEEGGGTAVAWTRFNERTDVDGNRVLHIEEVQSKRHQDGKRDGYAKTETVYIVKNPKGGMEKTVRSIEEGERVIANRRFPDLDNAEDWTIEPKEYPAGAPDAPFKTTWPMLAMKRMIRYAAENGFDRITWTTGDQQSARYDLSSHISNISWDRVSGSSESESALYDITAYKKNSEIALEEHGVNQKRIAVVIGKDLAKSIASDEGSEGVISGTEMKVGGEGMAAFYDKMLPNMVNKYTKKWGVKVGETSITTRKGSGKRLEILSELAGEDVYDASVDEKVHSLDITDKMRDSALSGQPLFSKKTGKEANNPLSSGNVGENDYNSNYEQSSIAGNGGQKSETDTRSPGGDRAQAASGTRTDGRSIPDASVHDEATGFDEDLAGVRFSKKRAEKIRPDTNAFFQAIKDFIAGTKGSLGKDGKILNEVTEKYGFWSKHLGTLDNLARKNPIIEPFMKMAKRMQMDKDEVFAKTNDVVKAYHKLKDDQRKLVDEALFDGTLHERDNGMGIVWRDDQLRDRGLDDTGIAGYHEVRAYFDEMTNDYQNRLLERIGVVLVNGKPETIISGDPSGKVKLDLANKILSDFNKLSGYFPLMRFGNFTLSQYNAEGELVKFETFESLIGRNAAAGKAQRENPENNFKVGRLVKRTGDSMVVDPRMISMLKDYADSAEEAGISDFVDEVEQKMLKEFADKSFRKRFIHRKGTAGYSDDVARTIASYGWSSSNFLAKMKWVPKLQEFQRNLDVKEYPQLHEHISKDIEYLKTPSEEFAAFKSFTFGAYMGFNVKSAAVNLTQIPMTLYPYLANKYGDKKTLAALTQATQDALNPKKVKDRRLRELLQWAEDEGLTMDSYTSDLIGVARGKKLARTRLQSRLIESMTFMFSAAEQYNRRVSVATAYYLNKDVSIEELKKQNGIIEQAVTKTQFDYGKHNRPAVFRGIVGVPLQFHQFSLNYLQFLAGNGGGVGATVRSLAVLFLLAGLMGMPGADDLRALLEFMYQKTTGKHLDFELEARKGIVKLAAEFTSQENAQTIAEAMLRGHVAYTPFDMTGSLSMGRVVPGMSRGFDVAANEGVKKGFTEAATDALGAGAGLVRNVAKGFDQYEASGDIIRGLETALPWKAVGNMLKSYRLTTDGVDRDYAGRVRIAFEPSSAEKLFQFLSFQPSTRSQLYREKNTQRREALFLRAAHNRLIIPLAVAIAEKNEAKKKAARRAIAEWNKSSPKEWRLLMSKVFRAIRRRRKEFEINSKTGRGSSVKQLQGKFNDQSKYFPK